MPNLFPEEEQFDQHEEIENDDIVTFGRSWKFNFEKGDFESTPTGKISTTDGLEAWIDWCHKALNTTRFRYLAYTDDHGQEFQELISRHLPRDANESEIRRMVIECLMVDPRTDRVENFRFEWDDDKLFYFCDVYNVRGENGTVSGSVVIS